LATGDEAEAIAARMESRCADFRTEVTRTPDPLEVVLRAATGPEEKHVE
jgi:hypothetical protein